MAFKKKTANISKRFHGSCSHTLEQWSSALNLPGFSTQIMDMQPITNTLSSYQLPSPLTKWAVFILHRLDLTSLSIVTEAMQTHRYTHTKSGTCEADIWILTSTVHTDVQHWC